MSESNSFKDLQKEQEEKYKKNTSSIKKSIDGNMDTVSLFSKIIDVYFSKVINYVVNVSGGDQEPSKEG